MFAGSLKMNIDTTTHDVYALLKIQQKVYGSWSLPNDATPSMQILEEIRYDRLLWRDLPYDPDKERNRNDYVTIVDTDKANEDGFMGNLSSAVDYVLWDAYCSYKERAVAIIKDYPNLSVYRSEQALTFLGLSERFHTIYTTLHSRIHSKKMMEIEAIVKKGTGMYIWQFREYVAEQDKKLQAAIEFTRYS